MADTVWVIDPDTKDLSFDDAGVLKTLEDGEAIAQNVRLTLEAFQGDFPLVPSHGTDYEEILGLPMDEDTVDEVIREAVFQEDRIAALDDLTVNQTDARGIDIRFSGRLNAGTKISTEVTAGG